MASRTRVAVTTPDESEDYDTPTSDSKGSASAVRGVRVASHGWGSSSSTERRETVKAPYLDLKGRGHRIVKILNEQPPVRYPKHFVNSKNRPYTCGLLNGDECPLCDAGLRASDGYMINVIDMEDPTKVLKWDFGPEVAEILKELTTVSRGGERVYVPLDDLDRYFEVYQVTVAGRKGASTKVGNLRSRDVEDDHGIMPLGEEELAELRGEPSEVDEKSGRVINYENLFGDEVIWISTYNQLKEIKVLDSDLPQRRK